MFICLLPVLAIDVSDTPTVDVSNRLALIVFLICSGNVTRGSKCCNSMNTPSWVFADGVKRATILVRRTHCTLNTASCFQSNSGIEQTVVDVMDASA